jgi:hypothetical protein
MNEQIEKIYGEACIHYGYLSEREFCEKFAQLIVRECAKIADIADENKCEWIGGNILTHFGVKE